MHNRTPMIFFPIASGASSDSANSKTSIILMPHGQSFTIYHATELAQSVRAFASLVGGLVHVLKSKPRQTYMQVVKRNRSTAERSVTGLSVTHPRR